MDRIVTGVQSRRIIRRGDRVTAGDLTTLRGRLSQLPRGAFTEHESLIGTIAQRELRPGEWLTGRMIDRPDVVKARQVVTIGLAHGPIQITCKGISQQGGSPGDIIRVKNLSSQREVLARVVNKDLVEVVF